MYLSEKYEFETSEGDKAKVKILWMRIRDGTNNDFSPEISMKILNAMNGSQVLHYGA